MRKRGRPMGPVLIAVLDLLKMKQMTAREVAIELKLSIEASKNACRRLRDADRSAACASNPDGKAGG